MIENIDPAVIGTVGTAVTIVGGGAAYAYFRGGDVSVDADQDGDTDVTFEDDGDVEVTYDGPDGNAIGVVAGEEERDEQPEDPTPEEVLDIGADITEVKGVGETRAEALNEAGFETATDLYYASDENLEAVNGLGSRAVGFIRDDIGGIDYEGNGESSDEDQSTSQETESGDENGSEQSNSKAETEQGTDESENSSSNDQNESSDSDSETESGSGNDSDESRMTISEDTDAEENAAEA